MKKNFQVLLSDEAKDFVRSLNIKAQQKVAYNIQKSRIVNDPKILKKLKNDIWEYRILSEGLQIRLLAFWDPDIRLLIICSHGFIKKTDKTPKKEMKKAIEFRQQYLNNKK